MPAPTIFLEGNVGRDAELRYTSGGSGTAVASFAVACNVGRDETNWYQVSWWGDAAEKAYENIQKGDVVTIIGTLKQESYKNKSGDTVQSLKLTANGPFAVSVHGRKIRQDVDEQAPARTGGVARVKPVVPDDDMPD